MTGSRVRSRPAAAGLTAALVALVVSLLAASRAGGTLPLSDSCLKSATPPTSPTFKSHNVQFLGTIPGEAQSLDPGGRLVGHYFYVTGSNHFSIYDVRNPLHPKLMSRVNFPCRFENEDVTVNGKVLIYTDFATTGDLYVYDVRDKRHPKLIADVPGAGTHTMGCLYDDCRFLYGSYHVVDRYGPLHGGEVVDLRDPHHPRVLGDWTAHGALPTHHVHWQYQVKPGFVLTSSSPIEYLDVRPGTPHSLVHPRVIASSDTPAVAPTDKRYHTAIWPRDGRDRFILASYETNGTPNCMLGSGDFSTFDTRGYAHTHTFKLLHSYYLSNGFYFNGNPAVNVLGCSPHWFNVRPSWHNGGVVALGTYDNGAEFLRVDHKGRIREIGYFLPPGAETSGAYWITCNIVYTVGYTEGVDILRLKDPASECGLRVSVTPRRVPVDQRERFHIEVTEPVDATGPAVGTRAPVPKATVHFAGHSVRTNGAGGAVIVATLHGAGQHATHATKPDYRSGVATVVATPNRHRASVHRKRPPVRRPKKQRGFTG